VVLLTRCTSSSGDYGWEHPRGGRITGANVIATSLAGSTPQPGAPRFNSNLWLGVHLPVMVIVGPLFYYTISNMKIVSCHVFVVI
jgi:hypothetical protein